MMRSSLITFVRRASPVVARSRVLGATPKIVRMTMSSSADKKPELQGGLNEEQLSAISDMFGKISKLETELKDLRKQVRTFGVDAPDGDSDGHVVEEMHEVEHIIEEAALHEDAKVINKQHKLADDVKKFHARDPEHDW